MRKPIESPPGIRLGDLTVGAKWLKDRIRQHMDGTGLARTEDINAAVFKSLSAEELAAVFSYLLAYFLTSEGWIVAGDEP